MIRHSEDGSSGISTQTATLLSVSPSAISPTRSNHYKNKPSNTSQISSTVLYVLPFYLSKRTRPSPTLNRDAPSVIRARIRAVTITVLISTTTTLLLTHHYTSLSWSACLHRLGFSPLSFSTTFYPLIVTAILFAGPLYKDVLVDGHLVPLHHALRNIRQTLSSSTGQRTYLAGPITEELLFRSTLIPVHLLSTTSSNPRTLLLVTPLYFGIAHLHHLYEFRLTYPRTPLQTAILRTAFQFTFTTLFGWYAAYVFLRTGNVYAVILIHVFCNYIGFPQLWGMIGDDLEDDASARTNGESASLRKQRRAKRKWQTLVYYVLLVGGLLGFVNLLDPLTEFPELALLEF